MKHKLQRSIERPKSNALAGRVRLWMKVIVISCILHMGDHIPDAFAGSDETAFTICPVYYVSSDHMDSVSLYIGLSHVSYENKKSVMEYGTVGRPESALREYLQLMTGEHNYDAYNALIDQHVERQLYEQIRDDWAIVTNMYLLDRYDAGRVSFITCRIAPPTKSGIPVWPYTVVKSDGEYQLMRRIRLESPLFAAMSLHGNASEKGLCSEDLPVAAQEVTLWEDWYRGEEEKSPVSIYIDGLTRNVMLPYHGYALHPSYVIVSEYVDQLHEGEYEDILSLFHDYEAKELRDDIHDGFVDARLHKLREAVRDSSLGEWRVIYEVDFGSKMALYLSSVENGDDVLLVTLWTAADGQIYITHGVEFEGSWTFDPNVRDKLLDSEAVKSAVSAWHCDAKGTEAVKADGAAR